MDKKQILNELWTARWQLRQASFDKNEVLKSVSSAIDILEGNEVPMEEEKPRPNPSQKGAKLLWYPFADTSGKRMGNPDKKYEKGYPEGAIVHFTAGQCDTEEDAKGSLEWGRNEGYVFFVIGPTGKVYQSFPLNQYGSHAGISEWPGLGSSVSSKLVGIEVVSAGILDNGKSWFGKKYDKSRTRTVKAKDNVKPGEYLKYTDAQEKSLTDLLLWLHLNNPEVFKIKYVLGHDEVAPSRKNDPGGALSMSMPEYRKYLADLVVKS